MSAIIALGVAQGAYAAEPSPWAICQAEAVSAREAVEHTMSPADGSTVEAGSQVTLSGESRAPLTFAIASSPGSVSSPDVDEGLGSAPAGSSTYLFTSAKAAATARTIYWAVSFSEADLPACAGVGATTYTTAPRSLTVVPNVTQEHEARETGERVAQVCVVPSLRGASLAKARRLLTEAHCRLGRVSRPGGHRSGPLRVVSQSVRSGTQLVEGARVRVRLGLVRHKHR